jgi:hypothetical protein
LETNLSGNLHRSRNVAERRYHPRDFILPSVLAAAKRSKLTRNQPEVFLKLLVLLVPREMKVEHSAAVKAMTQEQLEAAIEAIQAMLSARAVSKAKVMEAVPEPVALAAAARGHQAQDAKE